MAGRCSGPRTDQAGETSRPFYTGGGQTILLEREKIKKEDDETSALAARRVCCLTQLQMRQTNLKSDSHLTQNT